MGYLITILGVLGSIAANFAALRYFLRPVESSIGELKTEVKEVKSELKELRLELKADIQNLDHKLSTEIHALDRKYDDKTDQIRGDILSLARDMSRGSNLPTVGSRNRYSSTRAAA